MAITADSKKYSIFNGLNFADVSGDMETHGVDINQTHQYHNHPYSIKKDDAFLELVESIKEHGVLMPVIVRKSKYPEYGKEYEIISGHRRVAAAAEAGYTHVPAYIREWDDDVADIIMVDSNNQREDILISEKAWAYRIKYDALKRRAGRPKNEAENTENSPVDASLIEGQENGGQVGHNSKTVDLMAQESEDSRKQIQRYIRLTYLVKPLLEMVDKGDLPFTAGVELSYVKEMNQLTIFNIADTEEVKISLDQAKLLRELDKNDGLDIDTVHGTLTKKAIAPKEVKKEPAVKAAPKTTPLKKLFTYPDSYEGSTDDLRDLIQKLLDSYFAERG